MPEQSFLGSTSLKWISLTILAGDLKITFNLQYGKVLSIVFCSGFLISNDFLPRNGKTQTNPFFSTIQILERFINTYYRNTFLYNNQPNF